MIVSSVCHASSGKYLIAQSSKGELLVLSQTGNKTTPLNSAELRAQCCEEQRKMWLLLHLRYCKGALHLPWCSPWPAVQAGFVSQLEPCCPSEGLSQVCVGCPALGWAGLNSSVKAARPAGGRSWFIFTDLLMLESLRSSLHTYMELSLSHFYKYFRKTEDSLSLKKPQTCSFSCDSLNQSCPIIQCCSAISRADLFLPLLFIIV